MAVVAVAVNANDEVSAYDAEIDGLPGAYDADMALNAIDAVWSDVKIAYPIEPVGIYAITFPSPSRK